VVGVGIWVVAAVVDTAVEAMDVAAAAVVAGGFGDK
jgi:hypothetical protein